jgi:hypothetical protein
MAINPNQAQLTAINEALRALDHDCAGEARCDELVVEAVDILLDARSRLTSVPWPEFALPSKDAVAYEAWLEARALEQQRDGRR